MVTIKFQQGLFKNCDKSISEKLSQFTNTKSIVNNYCPIALSSNGFKFIETSVKDQLKEHLEDNRFLYKKQYGFRSRSNTQTALFDMIASIQAHLDRNKKTSAVFFDLSKAFDTEWMYLYL